MDITCPGYNQELYGTGKKGLFIAETKHSQFPE